jgi:hypothetical protein
MTEPDEGTYLDELLPLSGDRCVHANPELVSRLPQQRGFARRLRRGDHEELLGLQRQGPHPSGEALLEAAGQRSFIGQDEPAGHPCGGPSSRELQERQGVAAGLRDDPVPHSLVEPTRNRLRQQRSRILVAQARDAEVRKPVERGALVVVAQGEHHRDGLGQETSGHEREDLR